ncbi:MAG: hypothetical protein Faunusvirus11_11 [Faunusvirus sp.]|jgi:ankyrin repeat protein|uniref:Uncharacterized protein n=1 Tax=Faunusvirus sp. TaxID=2487766 RepID=A0A3G4ZWT2_9VIRU|nr:MAG: hypothetical protein Faunusvirus11_11 [Faunusvirus sp.]
MSVIKDAREIACICFDLLERGKENECIKYIDKYNNFYNLKLHNYEWTVLMAACWYEAPQVALKLIELGADVNVKSRENSTALIIASKRENIDVVRKLINAGADINVKTSYYVETALGVACKRDNMAIAILLIDSGANIADIIDNDKLRVETAEPITEYIKKQYIKQITATIDDKSPDNMMAYCFKTTYVSGIIYMIVSLFYEIYKKVL